MTIGAHSIATDGTDREPHAVQFYGEVFRLVCASSDDQSLPGYYRTGADLLSIVGPQVVVKPDAMYCITRDGISEVEPL